MNADVLIRSAGNFSAAGKSNSSAYGLKFTNRSSPTDRGVMICEADHVKTGDRSRVHQLGWGQSAVAPIRMRVNIDLQDLPLSSVQLPRRYRVKMTGCAGGYLSNVA